MFASTAMAASSREVVELRPNGAPNKSPTNLKESVDVKGNITNVTWARNELYRQKKSNGSVVVMIAGGDCGQLAMPTMGKSSAPFFNDLAYTVYVLKYQLPAGTPEVPLADVNKAVGSLVNAALKMALRRSV